MVKEPESCGRETLAALNFDATGQAAQKTSAVAAAPRIVHRFFLRRFMEEN
jgi:hypothetical protein